MDSRIIQLAKTIVNHSCKVHSGNKVTIDAYGSHANPLIKELVKNIYAVGGIPYVIVKDITLFREELLGITEETAQTWFKHDYARLLETDVYIMIKSYENQAELSDVPPECMQIYGKHYSRKIDSHIVNKTNWISIRYPNPSMAQLANMSTEAFEDYYFEVCNLDYSELSSTMDALVELMENTDNVQIIGPKTDITFSIKDIPVHKCDGSINLPDGEVYTAPVRDSINGHIQFNVPSTYKGTRFDNLYLEFENGKIIRSHSSNTTKMNEILDTDEGARFIGEFALGVNPLITRPIMDILFDEKIKGSFHLTPGFAYEDASNGNTSAIHWDMICIQTEEYGGGEIFFDDVLIRKDGLFVLKNLLPLNF